MTYLISSLLSALYIHKPHYHAWVVLERERCIVTNVLTIVRTLYIYKPYRESSFFSRVAHQRDYLP